MDFDLVQARKDTTRPSNAYYGINWGYRSDEVIEKSLDTGDLIMFNYDCGKLFSPEEIALCHKNQYLNVRSEDDPQNLGFCLRTPQKLLVVHSDLLGEVHIEPYSEFLNKPFMKSVKARSFEQLPPVVIEATANFVEEIRAEQLKQVDQQPDFFSRLWRQRMLKLIYVQHISKNVVAHMLFRSKILNCDPYLTPNFDYIEALSQPKPSIIHGAYKLSSPLMIRKMGQANVRK